MKSDIIIQKSRQDASSEIASDQMGQVSASYDQPGGLGSAFGSSSRSNYGHNDPLLLRGSNQGDLVIHEVEEDKFAS